MDLDASDEQLDCPFIYASARGGFAKRTLEEPNQDMGALFETIVEHIPAPEGDPDADTQVLISTIDYNEYVGRIGVGKVDNGTIRVNQECALVNHHDPDKFRKVKIGKLYEFDGLNKVEVKDCLLYTSHAGGSGCGCSAVTLCAYILPKIQSGEWKRVLFLPTGALLSTVSFNEGQSIPGIAHGVVPVSYTHLSLAILTER